MGSALAFPFTSSGAGSYPEASVGALYSLLQGLKALFLIEQLLLHLRQFPLQLFNLL